MFGNEEVSCIYDREDRISSKIKKQLILGKKKIGCYENCKQAVFQITEFGVLQSSLANLTSTLKDKHMNNASLLLWIDEMPKN